MYYLFEINEFEQYILLQKSTDYASLIDMKNRFELDSFPYKYIILKDVRIWRV